MVVQRAARIASHVGPSFARARATLSAKWSQIAVVGGLLALSVPAQTGAFIGTWEPPFNHDPAGGANMQLEAIHMTLLPLLPTANKSSIEASVLVWGHTPNQGVFDDTTSWAVLLPEQPLSTRFKGVDPTHPYGIESFDDSEGNLFCGGHSLLDNNNVIAGGGTAAATPVPPASLGSHITYEFEWSDETLGSALGSYGAWDERAPLARERWYASGLRFSDSRVGFFGGVVDSNGSDSTYEVFNRGLGFFGEYERWGMTMPPVLAEQIYDGPKAPAPIEAQLGQYARLHQLGGHAQEIFNAGPTGEASYCVDGQNAWVAGKFHPARVQHITTLQSPAWTRMLDGGAGLGTTTNTPRDYGCSVRMPLPWNYTDGSAGLDMVLNIGGKNWNPNSWLLWGGCGMEPPTTPAATSPRVHGVLLPVAVGSRQPDRRRLGLRARRTAEPGAHDGVCGDPAHGGDPAARWQWPKPHPDP